MRKAEALVFAASVAASGCSGVSLADEPQPHGSDTGSDTGHAAADAGSDTGSDTGEPQDTTPPSPEQIECESALEVLPTYPFNKRLVWTSLGCFDVYLTGWCVFREATDGKRRCMPKQSVSIVGFPLDTASVYCDKLPGKPEVGMFVDITKKSSTHFAMLDLGWYTKSVLQNAGKMAGVRVAMSAQNLKKYCWATESIGFKVAPDGFPFKDEDGWSWAITDIYADSEFVENQ